MADDRIMTRLEVEWESLSFAQREAAQQMYEEDFGESADLYTDLSQCPEAAAIYVERVRAIPVAKPGVIEYVDDSWLRTERLFTPRRRN